MQIGNLPKRVSEEQLREKLSEISGEGEEFIFACDGITGGNKKVVVVISNLRFLVLELDLQSVRNEIKTQELSEFKTSWLGLTLEYNNEDLTFAVSSADRKVLASLDEVHKFANPNLKPSKESIAEDPTEKKLRKKREYEEKKSEFKRDYEEKKRLKKEEKLHKDLNFTESDLENYGRVVHAAKLHTFKAQVVLYEKGYVSVGGCAPEKLLAISGNADVTRKSEAGRAAVAVLTLGANLDANSNIRGNVYLTILTDVRSHVQSVDLANVTGRDNPVQKMNEIVAAGEYILKSLELKTSTAAPVAMASGDIANQLSQLATLYQSGALSEDEFNVAKAKILGA
jgi:hypothetical protein